MKILIFTATLLSLTFSTIALAQSLPERGPFDGADSTLNTDEPEFSATYIIRDMLCSGGTPQKAVIKPLIGDKRLGAWLRDGRSFGVREMVFGNTMVFVETVTGDSKSPCNNNGKKVQLITVYEKETQNNSASKK